MLKTLLTFIEFSMLSLGVWLLTLLATLNSTYENKLRKLFAQCVSILTKD
jgi:hypothetical protein